MGILQVRKKKTLGSNSNLHEKHKNTERYDYVNKYKKYMNMFLFVIFVIVLSSFKTQDY